MRREDSQKKKNSWTTADSLRKSPTIPDPSCLDRMERERQEYLECRGRMLREMNSKYEQTQEVILRRIRSSIHDRDHPSTHNAVHHQSTRRLHRSNDICLEPQMKRGGLGHILLKPLREKKACSSMKSLSGSDVNPPYMEPFPPSDEPRKRERPHRRVWGLKMAVEQDCSPFRPEDPSPELCTPEPPPAPKPSRLPRPRNLHMLAKKGNKAYFAPGSKIPRWRGLDRQRRKTEAQVEPEVKGAAPKAAEVAVRQAFKLLQDEEWERKIEGLELVRALAEHHPKVLLSGIDDICLTVIQEVKNLRSMTVWNATSRICSVSALNSPSNMEGGCLCSLSPVEKCTSVETYSPVHWSNLKDLCVFSSICTPEPPPAAKPSRLPRPRSLHMLAKKGNKAYIAPGSKIPRWRGLVRQSKRPEETDQELENNRTTVLRKPVPPPAAAKLSRLPRPESLHMLAKLGNKAYIAPGSKIPRLRGLVRQRRNPGEGHVEPVGNRNVLEVAELSQERRPEAQLNPTVKKPAAVRQRRRADSYIKPVESRAAPKAVEVSQGRAETLETPALISEQPLRNPELALRQTFKLLQDEEWERKIEGLKLMCALAEHHPEVLLPELHDICLTVIQEVKNLRSMVSRAAMTTLAHLYAHLQRKMDQEVESTACVLLHKAGESSQFIREDVEVALSMMVQNCSPGRVLHALLTGGFSHRNAAVRRCTAQHLEKLACLQGASRLLNGKKDFTCKFLTAISKLALDSAQEVRLHARNTLRFLGSHKDFMKMVEKFVAPRDKTSIKDIITKTR